VSGIYESAPVENVVTALNRILDLQVRCIHDTKGMILTSVGDAILAVWTPSHVKPSHAELAFGCGRKILERWPEVQSQLEVSFQLRIALATGKMTGDLIAQRFQVVGAPCTTAKRLMDLADVPRRSQMLYTSETLQLIAPPTQSRQVAKIGRSSGEELAVFEFTA